MDLRCTRRNAPKVSRLRLSAFLTCLLCANPTVASWGRSVYSQVFHISYTLLQRYRTRKQRYCGSVREGNGVQTAQKVSADERQACIENLDRLASSSPDGLSGEWESLLQLLNLGLDCFLAVHKVLQQARWRNADNPIAYIKIAAKTEARKMNPNIPCNDAPLIFIAGNIVDEGADPEGVGAAIREERRKKGKAPLPAMEGPHYSLEQLDWGGERRVKEEMFANDKPGLPHEFWIKGRIDWRKLGRKAGLDPGEIEVLEYRSQGISRDRAMEMQPDEPSRKTLQAAWKRVDRAGMKRIQDLLNKFRQLPQP